MVKARIDSWVSEGGGAAVMPLRVGVLGPVSAWRSALEGPGQELALGQPRQQAVLGMLAVRANRVVSRPELIDGVWGDQPPASAEGGIYTYIAGLRRILEPDRPPRDAGASRRQPARVLVSVGGGYMLRLEPGALDAVAFEQGLARFRAARAARDLATAASALDGALALWRGEAFTGIPGPFAEAERLRLGELRTLATEERGDLLLARGRPAEAVVELTALVTEFPLRERARALLMTALYRCGRQADALEAFRDARARLAEDLGIDPGPELTQVHQQVLATDPELAGPGGMQRITLSGAGIAEDAEPAGHVPVQIPAQIPPEVAGFAGRDVELAQLRATLPAAGGTPIVVLTGTAGVGKTALAIRFAREVAGHFPDGQLYANLHGFDPSAAPADPSAALRGFLEALGVAGSQVPASLEMQTGLLRSLLAGKRMLLLLDNAQTTSQVRPLLPGSSGCMVVITSRDQLAGLVAAEGARLIPLDVLSEDEARDMLAARLGAARIAAEPGAVTELIRQSARLPLALSVASARAVTRPGIALAALTAELRDARVRLDPLEAGDLATDLRAVFSWSQARLSPSAARMFRLQGVIPGPDLAVGVAASLAGVPLAEARSALTELCRASLLTEDAAGRLGCHDLLRAYAAEQARAVDGDPEVDAAQRRLLDHYLRTAHDAALKAYPARFKVTLPPVLPGVTPERLTTYEEIAAWFRAEQKALMAAVTLAGDRGLADDDPAGAGLMNTYCWQLAWSCAPHMMRLGHWVDMATAMRTALEAAQRLGDPVVQAQVHYEVGYARCRLGDYDEADLSLRTAVKIATDSGDLASLALAHHGLCLVYDQQDRYAEALPHAREALRLRSSLGDSAVVAYAENTVGWIYANLGQPAQALEHCKRALELHRESGSRSGVADTLDSIGFAHEALGDHEAAIDHYQQSVALFHEIGDPRGEATALIGSGDVQLAAGQLDDARRSWELALSIVTAMPGGNTEIVRGRLARLPADDAHRTGTD
jgi:DNA-binding SARP family transcriptional activator/predicted negative regulator of RcsB-dependent stress response